MKVGPWGVSMVGDVEGRSRTLGCVEASAECGLGEWSFVDVEDAATPRVDSGLVFGRRW